MSKNRHIDSDTCVWGRFRRRFPLLYFTTTFWWQRQQIERKCKQYSTPQKYSLGWCMHDPMIHDPWSKTTKLLDVSVGFQGWLFCGHKQTLRKNHHQQTDRVVTYTSETERWYCCLFMIVYMCRIFEYRLYSLFLYRLHYLVQKLYNSVIQSSQG